MKTLNNKELDLIISQALQREQIIERVSREALAQVKKINRQRAVRRVLRLVSFAFGVPTMLAVMGYGAYSITTITEGAMGYIAAAVTVISAVGVATYSITNFSLDEV